MFQPPAGSHGTKTTPPNAPKKTKENNKQHEANSGAGATSSFGGKGVKSHSLGRNQMSSQAEIHHSQLHSSREQPAPAPSPSAL